jgi:hypothetical protein
MILKFIEDCFEVGSALFLIGLQALVCFALISFMMQTLLSLLTDIFQQLPG